MFLTTDTRSKNLKSLFFQTYTLRQRRWHRFGIYPNLKIILQNEFKEWLSRIGKGTLKQFREYPKYDIKVWRNTLEHEKNLTQMLLKICSILVRGITFITNPVFSSYFIYIQGIFCPIAITDVIVPNTMAFTLHLATNLPFSLPSSPAPHRCFCAFWHLFCYLLRNRGTVVSLYTALKWLPSNIKKTFFKCMTWFF